MIEGISKTLRRAEVEHVTFGEVIYRPGGVYGPRQQEDFQLVVVIEGQARVLVGAHEVLVGSGEVALFRPGQREHFFFSEQRPTHHSWCSVAPQLLPPKLAKACAQATATQPLSARLATLLELALALPAHETHHSPELVEQLGLAALAAYTMCSRGNGAAAQRGADASAPLQLALAWIGQHHGEPVTAEQLARIAGVSSAQLTKLFRRHLGTTPMRALWTARTRAGIRLLVDTGLGVAEIAYHCGFQTPFHFSRWVRALEGQSPSEVRRRAWEGRR